MKKEELKKDPFREFLLGLISKAKDYYGYITIGLIIVVSCIVIVSSREAIQDYSVCIDRSISGDLISSYCQSDQVSIELDKYTDGMSLSSSGSLISFLFKIKEMSDIDKLEALSAAKINTVEDLFLKSRLFKLKGDLLLDVNRFNESVKAYNDAYDCFEDKRDYSALLHYNIAATYMEMFLNDKGLEYLKKAKQYVDTALSFDIADSFIKKDVNVLKARIDYEL
ncbi:MAG: hypothetical protein CBC84_002200 [Pelagibacteraceae bacterium TMED124]|nr:hypothetical protein [Candidatus Neomarinimicrobiota bacterium]RPG17360.1 MAG: hypothetical protein CBC84_002200 [Pelagibacteraceae bacterium TMED124]|tara:strand:+ start:64 stop:735 length:672 start_codon:yes stop_codon:yes gene_type:complete